MTKWEDKTDTFSDKERNYNGKRLVKCNVLNEEIECSYFKAIEDKPDEIYVNFGIMFGVVYVSRKEGPFLYKIIRDDIKETYNKYGTNIPGDYIDEFCKKYRLEIPNDIFFSIDPFEMMLKMSDPN